MVNVKWLFNTIFSLDKGRRVKQQFPLLHFYSTLLQYNTSSQYVQGLLNIIAEDCK